MPMPTRRTVRPDSKHYRDSRRQRQARSLRRGGKRGIWMALAAIFTVGLLVAGMTMLASQNRHAWTFIVLDISIVGVVICIAAALLAGR